MEREPRAALILNRFTRTHTIMFATNAVSTILGVEPEHMKDKSFYECIQENCLADAVRCLESAKANDSIAYLRFWYRDPRRAEDFVTDQVEDVLNSDDVVGNNRATLSGYRNLDFAQRPWVGVNSSSLKQHSTPENHYVLPAYPPVPEQQNPRFPPSGGEHLVYQPPLIFELEAVVSCTSDGLVVVLRKARPPIPVAHPPLLPFDFENGLFAAPWGQQSITPLFPPDILHSFQPPLLPQYMPLRENVKAAGGPPLDQLMRSIRDVAVFAWALVGINENLAAYGRGLPTGISQLPGRGEDMELIQEMIPCGPPYPLPNCVRPPDCASGADNNQHSLGTGESGSLTHGCESVWPCADNSSDSLLSHRQHDREFRPASDTLGYHPFPSAHEASGHRAPPQHPSNT